VIEGLKYEVRRWNFRCDEFKYRPLRLN